MGWLLGGRKLEGELEELKSALTDYFAALNDVKMGITSKVPEPPEALVRWRQCQATGFPLVAGGLLDQPHIWLLEIAVVLEVEMLFERLNREADNASTNKPQQPNIP